MKKHMLKETNDMRRLMGLDLLNEEVTEVVNEMEKVGDHEERDEFDGRPSEVIGVDSDIEKQREMKEENTLNEVSMEEKDAYCQKEFGKDYKDCTEEQQKQCDDHCGKVNEDPEGEETYNYGEDEGADHKEEEHLEDEEEMAPHDRIKAIEDHLEALKKDMGYDEDHEDRDEEGTHFAEGKKYNEVLNTLTESEYKKLKEFIK